MIRLYRMDCLNTIKLFALLTFVHATSGQTVTVSGPSRAANATDVLITCAVNGGTLTSIQWVEVNSGGGASTIFNGDAPFSANPKYSNFKVTSLLTTESVMTIETADVGDDGAYRCQIPTDETTNPINLVVEANSTVTLTLTSIVTDNVDMYVATCYAAGGKPQETITWTLNGDPQTDGTNGNTIAGSNPPATAPLSNTKSVFTFPATLENYGQTLICQVSGHDVLTELNENKPIDLDIHASPSDAGTTVTVDYATQGASVTVSCIAQNQPSPAMRNYYIFSNDTSIHESMEEVNTVTVSAPEEGTPYTCMAGNYLGNTTLSAAVPYDPSRPTIPPTTEPITEGTTTYSSGSPATEPSTTSIITTGMPGEDSTADGPNVAAIAGGVVAAIVIIVIIVIAVCYCKTQERFCFEAGGTPPPSNKPSGRAVGSSNGSGSEKDVESPLNGVKDVTAEEKLPQAAPRGHGSIQHTNDNPDQAMYAMVDKKPARGGGGGAGDAPDRGSAPGQNEPPGMLYADLDLSHKAGHTDKHVPKNENDVVVYSSILV